MPNVLKDSEKTNERIPVKKKTHKRLKLYVVNNDKVTFDKGINSLLDEHEVNNES